VWIIRTRAPRLSGVASKLDGTRGSCAIWSRGEKQAAEQSHLSNTEGPTVAAGFDGVDFDVDGALVDSHTSGPGWTRFAS